MNTIANHRVHFSFDLFKDRVWMAYDYIHCNRIRLQLVHRSLRSNLEYKNILELASELRPSIVLKGSYFRCDQLVHDIRFPHVLRLERSLLIFFGMVPRVICTVSLVKTCVTLNVPVRGRKH